MTFYSELILDCNGHTIRCAAKLLFIQIKYQKIILLNNVKTLYNFISLYHTNPRGGELIDIYFLENMLSFAECVLAFGFYGLIVYQISTI